MKTCPFCAEQIDDNSVQCAYCGESLAKPAANPSDASVNNALTGSATTTSLVLCNRYEVDRELGRGGMGVVYLARDRERGRAEVAIKVLPPELSADPRAADDLRNEANLAMSLSHPNIVRLHNLEFDAEKNSRFLVMEYIKGPSLDRVGRLPLEKAMGYVTQALEGLAYAHRRGIVHLDLKPSNIIVDLEGTAKIADFGIARKLKESLTRLTGRNTTGTLLYMSPEQLRGESLDVRADIYSMGCVMYEALAGRPPFHTGAIEWQIINELPPPLDGIPAHVSKAIFRCLAKRREDRFPSASEFSSALASPAAAVEERPLPKTPGRPPHGWDPAILAVRERDHSTGVKTNPRTPPPPPPIIPASDDLLVPEDRPRVSPPPKPATTNSCGGCIVLLIILGLLGWGGYSWYKKEDARKKRESESRQQELQKTREAEAQKFVDRAKGRLTSRDWNGMVDDCNAALELNPNSAWAYVYRAHARIELGSCDAAISDCDRAIGLDSTNGRAYGNRGLARHRRGDPEAALNDYTQAINLSPREPTWYYDRGLAYRALFSYDAAIRDLRQALQLAPAQWEYRRSAERELFNLTQGH